MLRQYFLGMIQHQKEPAQDFNKRFIVSTFHAWIVFCSSSHFIPPNYSLIANTTIYTMSISCILLKSSLSLFSTLVCAWVIQRSIHGLTWARFQRTDSSSFRNHQVPLPVPSQDFDWFGFLQVSSTVESPPLWLFCCNQKTFFAIFFPCLWDSRLFLHPFLPWPLGLETCGVV